MRLWTRARAIAGLSAAAVVASVGVATQALATDSVHVQVLSISDFHRQLSPPKDEAGGIVTGPDGQKVRVGGAAYLATHVKRLQRDVENSIFMAAGDSYAGAPFESDVLSEEPTVEALNNLGLDFSTVGNHELDWGKDFLLDHIVNGECFGEIGKDSCFDDSTGERFHGADFDYYTGNVFEKGSDSRILDPYVIKHVKAPGGKEIPVGVINITLHGTERMPASFQPGLETVGTVEAVNKYAEELTSKGVKAILANVHEGADPAAGADHPIDSCENVEGDVIDSATRISPAVDGIVGGHDHKSFNCQVPDPAGNPRLVVEPGPYGGVINEIDLALDPDTGEVVRDETTTRNLPVTRDVPADPAMQGVVDYWVAYGEAYGQAPIAEVTGDFTKERTAAGESTLGNLAADMNLWGAEQSEDTRADFGLVMTDAHGSATNQLGDDITVADSGKPGDAEGRVMFREAFNAYGGGNQIMTVTVTGEQIDAALEQQWKGTEFGPVAVSKNVSYSYDPAAPIGQRIDPADVLINGEPLDPGRRYRVAMESYTALGKDGLTALATFTEPVLIAHDHDLVPDYVEAMGTLTPAPTGRVSLA